MALYTLVRRNYDVKLLVSIKCHYIHLFKKGVILLCQSIVKAKRISHLFISALFTVPLISKKTFVLVKTTWRRLQRNDFSSSNTSSRGLQVLSTKANICWDIEVPFNLILILKYHLLRREIVTLHYDKNRQTFSHFIRS